jgi:Peptidase A4 family
VSPPNRIRRTVLVSSGAMIVLLVGTPSVFIPSPVNWTAASGLGQALPDTPIHPANLTGSWSGYAYCPAPASGACAVPPSGHEIRGVAASFTVPAVIHTGWSNQTVIVWVGVGGTEYPGELYNPLVQAGVDAVAGNNTSQPTTYDAWWELLPDFWVVVNLTPLATISAGDTMFVRVVFGGYDPQGHQLWNFLIQDNSTRSGWNGTESCVGGCYSSVFQSADWILEGPLVCNPSTPCWSPPIPAFSSTRFARAMYLTDAGNWSYLSGNESGLYSFLLTQGGPWIGAAPSLVYPIGSFWVQYLVDTADTWEQGRWGNLTVSISNENVQLNGSLVIDSPEAFNGSWASLPGFGSSLALAIELTNSSGPQCVISEGPDSTLVVSNGSAIYRVGGSVCRGLPAGNYTASVTLWYVTPGTEPGENGSLLLFDTGSESSASVTIVGPPGDMHPLEPGWWVWLGPAAGGIGALVGAAFGTQTRGEKRNRDSNMD